MLIFKFFGLGNYAYGLLKEAGMTALGIPIEATCDE